MAIKQYWAGNDDNHHRRGRALLPEGDSPDLPVEPPEGRDAIWSEAFYDKIAGINCLYKNAAAGNVYNNWQECTDYLIDLGFKTVRDRLNPNSSSARANQRLAYPQLAAAGIKLHTSIGVAAVAVEATDQQHNIDCLNEIIGQHGSDAATMWRSIGGHNEPNDEPKLANWQGLLRTNQQHLYNLFHGNSIMQNVNVAAPALKYNVTDLEADFLAMGATGINAFVDVGDFHRYAGGIPTNGMDETLGWARGAFPAPKPMYQTEGGFNTGLTAPTGGNPFDVTTQAVYTIRWFCEAYIRGIRPFFFELMDDPGAAWEANWGLVEVNGSNLPANWTVKPSYTTVKRFFSRIADPGATYVPLPLEINVTGGNSNYKDILLQKRNGKHLLLMWRDESVWNTGPMTPRTVSPINITLSLQTARPLAVFNPRTSATAVQTGSSALTHVIPVAGDLLIAEIG